MEASCSDKEIPTLAYFKAPQSLHPSPTIATINPIFYKIIIKSVFYLGFILAYTFVLYIN